MSAAPPPPRYTLSRDLPRGLGYGLLMVVPALAGLLWIRSLAGAAPEEDPAASVRVVEWHWHDPAPGGPYVQAVGQLRNDADVPLGVVLRVTGRDSAGRVVASENVYLTTYRIPPGGTRSFRCPVHDRGIDRTKGDVTIVGVRR